MKPKLLLIDDDQGILDTYSELLADHFRVTTANNVNEGIKKLASNSYKVAIVDIDFSESSEGGINIVRFIGTNKLKTKPIILTAQGSVDKFRKVFKNVYDFIEKGSPNYRASTEVLSKALEAITEKKSDSYSFISILKHLPKFFKIILRLD
jgi:DNA-binding NtrC family response regulator